MISPIYEKRSWWIKKELDIAEMKKGIKFFLGKHNFSTMRAASCSAKSPIKTITKAEVKKKGNKIVIILSLNLFYKNK